MPGPGHNGGPPLPEEDGPEWGEGDPFVYFAWKSAHAKAWKSVPWETMLRRQARAEAIGLTYEEYTLEILERGRYLTEADGAQIAAIKARRPKPKLVPAEDMQPRPSAREAVRPPRRRA